MPDDEPNTVEHTESAAAVDQTHAQAEPVAEAGGPDEQAAKQAAAEQNAAATAEAAKAAEEAAVTARATADDAAAAAAEGAEPPPPPPDPHAELHAALDRAKGKVDTAKRTLMLDQACDAFNDVIAAIKAFVTRTGPPAAEPPA